MKRTLRRWWPTLVFGAVLGFALRLAWEKWPAVRFATGGIGILVQGMTRSDEAPRAGKPSADVFSLDAIAAAPDAAAEMRRWREKVQAMPADLRTQWLNGAVDVSSAGIRAFMARMTHDSALRTELVEWQTLVQDIIDKGGPALLPRALVGLARIDLGLAFDAAVATGDPNAINGVLMVMAEEDPAAALALAEERGIGADVRSFMLTIQGLRDPRAALDAIFAAGHKLTPEAQATAGALLARLPLAEALALCRAADGAFNAEAVRCLAETESPHRAAAVFKAIQEAGPDAVAALGAKMDELAQRMAGVAPDAALQWVRAAQARGESASGALPGVVATWAARDPQVALDLAFAEKDPKLRATALEASFTQLTRTDPAQGLDFLMRPGVLDAMAEQRRTGAFSGQPATALAAVADKVSALPASPATDAVQRDFAGSWAWQDPAAAFEWAKAGAGDAALAAVAGQWLGRAPAAAWAHAGEFPDEAKAYIVAADYGGTLEQRVSLLQATPGEALKGTIQNPATPLPATLGGGTFGDAYLARMPAERRSETAENFVSVISQNPGSSAAELQAAASYLPHVDDPVRRLELEEKIHTTLRRAGY